MIRPKLFGTTAGLAGLLLVAGCATINDACYEHTQLARAAVQYHDCGNPDSSPYPKDYRKGWIDGFYEVTTGGPDCPPAIAPACYWKPGQILKHCDNRRHAYYSGWQDGAANASQFPDTHYLKIFETCECPFPRCETPCADGFCGPCGDAVVGMPISDELIEVPYRSPVPLGAPPASREPAGIIEAQEPIPGPPTQVDTRPAPAAPNAAPAAVLGETATGTPAAQTPSRIAPVEAQTPPAGQPAQSTTGTPEDAQRAATDQQPAADEGMLEVQEKNVSEGKPAAAGEPVSEPQPVSDDSPVQPQGDESVSTQRPATGGKAVAFEASPLKL